MTAAQPAVPPRERIQRRQPGQPLSTRRPEVNVGTGERWLSAAVGAGLIAAGVARRSTFGALFGLIGGALLYRGASGHCAVSARLGRNSATPRRGVLVERSMTIGRPAEELYRFWRQLENLPRFMKHLQAVKTTSPTRSHWVAKAPAGASVEWDAELIDDIPGELLVWRSLPGSDIENEGAVRFVRAPGDRGTEVHVVLRYDPPAGQVGAAIARLLGEEPHGQIEDDLRRFKQVMETGEIATTQGQPRGHHPAVSLDKLMGGAP